MRRWHELPIVPIAEADLLRAAADGRVLVADHDGPHAPYPIVRVRLELINPAVKETPP